MSVPPVKWILIVRFNLTAHRAIYGRFQDTLYTKDYLQLSRRAAFMRDLESAFPSIAGGNGKASITYRWPGGSASGELIKNSADRPHLSWSTTAKAPPPWKMSPAPTKNTPETIQGNPDHKNAALADAEYEALSSSDFGQPYLVAINRTGEENVLHLRVLVDGPGPNVEWADVETAPAKVQELVAKTSKKSAVVAVLLEGGETLFFDDLDKANPWRTIAGSRELTDNFEPTSDFAAEEADYDDEEVSALERKTEEGDYEVPDATANLKTRGSAQRVFAKKVKEHYGWRCALTGIATRSYLIASHIVPWGHDQSIRLDPANGICLSVFVDKAFEQGHLLIDDDLTVRVNWDQVHQDDILAGQLRPFDGSTITPPKASPPKPDYLKRRRAMSS